MKQPSQAFESDDASGDDQPPDIGSGSFSSPALLSLTPDLMAALCLRLPLASICALSQAVGYRFSIHVCASARQYWSASDGATP